MNLARFFLLIFEYLIFFGVTIFCCVFSKVNCSIVAKHKNDITQHDFLKKTLGGKAGVALLVAVGAAFLNTTISAISSFGVNSYANGASLLSQIFELLGFTVLLVGTILLFVGEKSGVNKLKLVGIILSFVFFAITMLIDTIGFIASLSSAYYYSELEYIFNIMAYGFRWAFILPSFIIFAVKFKNVLSFTKGNSDSITLPKFIFVGLLVSFILFTFFTMCRGLVGIIDNSLYSSSSETEFILNYYALIILNLASLCSLITLPIVYNTVVNSSYATIKEAKESGVEHPSVVSSKDVVTEIKKEKVVSVAATYKNQPVQSQWKPLTLEYGVLYDAYGNVVTKYKERRSLALNIIFSGATLFILPLVTGSKMIKELNGCRTPHGGDKSKGFAVMMLIFDWLTFGIAPLIWGHRVTRRYGDELKYRGIDYKVGAWMYWVLFILLSETLICPIIYLHKIFKASRLINAHHNKFGDLKVSLQVSTAHQETLKLEKVEDDLPSEEKLEIEPQKPTSNVEKMREENNTQASSSNKPSVEDRLARAKKMLEDGLIEESEYKEIRANILKDL